MAGIYVHVPYCRQACTYCDFYFTTKQDSQPAYVQALLREIDLTHGFFAPRIPLETVYFGGGTPSLLPLASLQAILQALHATHGIAPDAEITLEANPDDLTPEQLRAWHQMGINRLSIGIQSLDDAQLRWMGRAHNAQQARAVVPMAQDAGFDNLTVDLIYHLPGLTDVRWEQTLHEALGWGVPHLSCYGLTVEPRTALAHQVKRGTVTIPSDDAFIRQMHLLRDIVVAHGVQQYEISNFARPGWESRHNSSYWTGAPYLGLGPSAHGFDGQRTRYANVAQVHSYIQQLQAGKRPVADTEVLTPRNRYNERLLTALRLTAGLPLLEVLQDLTPADQAWVRKELLAAADSGEFVNLPHRLQLSPTAMHLADAMASRLMLSPD